MTSTDTSPLAASAASPPTAAPTSLSPTARTLWRRSRGLLLALVIVLAAAVVIAAVRSGARPRTLWTRGPPTPRQQGRRATPRGPGRVHPRGHHHRRPPPPSARTPPSSWPTRTCSPRASSAPSPGSVQAPAAAPFSSPPAPPSVGTLAPGITADPAPSLHTTLSPGCDLPTPRRAGDADTGGGATPPAHPAPTPATSVTGCPPCCACPHAKRRRHRPPRLARHPLQRASRRARQRLPRAPTPRLPAPSGLVPPFAVRRRGHRRTERTQLLRPASPPAGCGAPCNSPSPPSSRPCGVPAASAPSSPNASRSPSAPPKPLKAAPASTARPTPATARPPPCAPRPVPASPPSSVSRPPRRHTPEVLLPALSARLHATGPRPATLLFGPPPRDDAALVQLADHLDALEREVRVS